jgi:hypothetical protein
MQSAVTVASSVLLLAAQFGRPPRQRGQARGDDAVHIWMSARLGVGGEAAQHPSLRGHHVILGASNAHFPWQTSTRANRPVTLGRVAPPGEYPIGIKKAAFAILGINPIIHADPLCAAALSLGRASARAAALARSATGVEPHQKYRLMSPMFISQRWSRWTLMLIAPGQSQSATSAARASEEINVDQTTMLLRYTAALP